MKLRHKVLIAALSLITITSTLLTFALLTYQTDTVTNTFTVGQVYLKLDETDVNELGVPIENAPRVINNEYKVIPGKTYVKDPTATVLAGSESSYIRLLVTITKTNELKEVLGENFLPENYVTGWNKDIWTCTNITENNNNSITYEFRYYKLASGIVDGTKQDVVLEPLFTNFTAPSSLNNETLKKIEGFEIKVVGHAIQADGFKTADEAWAAFDIENATVQGGEQ